MRALLADDLAAYITTASGDTARVDGADIFMASIQAMDLPSATFSVLPTQAPVAVDPERVLIMVEVRASLAEIEPY